MILQKINELNISLKNAMNKLLMKIMILKRLVSLFVREIAKIQIYSIIDIFFKWFININQRKIYFYYISKFFLNVKLGWKKWI